VSRRKEEERGGKRRWKEAEERGGRKRRPYPVSVRNNFAVVSLDPPPRKIKNLVDPEKSR
jgi:hypothetical protein